MRVLLPIGVLGMLLVLGCDGREGAPTETAQAQASPAPVGNLPPLDATNIVSISLGSPDHTTLVAALKAADYVTVMSASGPLTVFAPTNAAFAALPPGTVESLLQPENVDKLREILKYHVTTSALTTKSFKDGQSLGMANGAKTTLHVNGDKVSINDANIVASIPASNGIVHVVDVVLLPPSK